MRVVIVGCSAGGAGVAARLRRLDESTEIIVIEKSDSISFATCGIPYYLGGVINERERLDVVSKEEFALLLNVDVKTNSELIAIDNKLKKVLIQNRLTKKLTEENYDKLVLATGGSPIRPDVEGINRDNIFTLRNAEDTDAAFDYLKNNQINTALIIGAGFIGLELAENLHARKLHVSVLDSADQVMGAWDYEMAAMLQKHMRTKGINLILNNGLQKILPDGVKLSNGEDLKADVIFLCIGVRPNIKLAQDIGLKIGKKGGILVNPGMVTSDPDIYALGDAVEVMNNITHDRNLIPLAGIAQRQARVVADNIVGMHRSFAGAQGVAIAKVFDLTIAITGLTEQQLRIKNINYKRAYIETPSHAGFYPDAFPMIIKLLFSANSGRVLGAQIVGVQGVDKRIDVIASAIQFNRTVYDLAELELAYAPPFSSAKDPVNIIGMTAVNMLEHDYQVIHWNELDEVIDAGGLLLDVRTGEEYEIDHLSGALHIPLTELRARCHELPIDRTIVTYCQQGKKGYFAAKLLKQYGFNNVLNLSGGQKIYQLVKQERRLCGIFAQEQVTSNDVIRSFPQSVNHLDEKIELMEMSENVPPPVAAIDATDMYSPGPMMRLVKEILDHKAGDIIKIIATDPEFEKDVRAWLRTSQHDLVSIDEKSGSTIAYIRVGDAPVAETMPLSNPFSAQGVQGRMSKIVNYLRERESDTPAVDQYAISSENNAMYTNMMTIDACGLSCPGPIMKLSKIAKDVSGGERITITATDTGFSDDLVVWSTKKGFRIVNLDNRSSKITAVLEKL